jgi:hypothetical protein
MLTGDFRGDLLYLKEKLIQRDHFAFSKFADGELAILRNIKITNCDNWTFVPAENSDEHKALMDSFTYVSSNYYIGICCPCCINISHVNWMRTTVRTHLVTWANLFVNSNYEDFKKHFFPIFDSWEKPVILVATEKALGKRLPFRYDWLFPIGTEAWKGVERIRILSHLSEVVRLMDGALFLFSAGPLGNMLCSNLNAINERNTYIDIGSTINPWTVGMNRGYLQGQVDASKTCVW